MKEIAHLYSGGTDSTYAAILMLKIYDKVRLLTYDRLGFKNVHLSKRYVAKLQKIFGYDRVTHTIMNIDSEYKILSRVDNYTEFFKYGFFNLMTCGLCKLAMHWRTIIYCLDNGIKYVSDGSGKEMYVDPSQHSAVIPEMRKLYKRFGIQYLSPSFDTSPEEREGVLFKMGISERQVIKWTDATWELQPICSQEYLHLLHVQYKCKKRIFQLRDLQPDYLKYEKRMLDFHKHKREKLVWLIERYIAANKIVTS